MTFLAPHDLPTNSPQTPHPLRTHLDQPGWFGANFPALRGNLCIIRRGSLLELDDGWITKHMVSSGWWIVRAWELWGFG